MPPSRPRTRAGSGTRSRRGSRRARRPAPAGTRRRRVDRIDLAIDAAGQVVGLERPREVLERVAAAMVVLDPQVAVAPQALRDDEIVRLVAAREDRRSGEAEPRRRTDERGDEKDSGGLRPSGAAEGRALLMSVYDTSRSARRGGSRRAATRPAMTSQTTRRNGPASAVHAGSRSASQGRYGSASSALAKSGRTTSASAASTCRQRPVREPRDDAGQRHGGRGAGEDQREPPATAAATWRRGSRPTSRRSRRARRGAPRGRARRRLPRRQTYATWPQRQTRASRGVSAAEVDLRDLLRRGRRIEVGVLLEAEHPRGHVRREPPPQRVVGLNRSL